MVWALAKMKKQNHALFQSFGDVISENNKRVSWCASLKSYPIQLSALITLCFLRQLEMLLLPIMTSEHSNLRIF